MTARFSHTKAILCKHICLLLLFFVMTGTVWAGSGFETGEYKTITIKKGDTLGKISRDQVGAYSNSFINQILKLNPEIVDKNHIAAGKILHVPIITKKSASLIPKKSDDSMVFLPPLPPEIDSTIIDAYPADTDIEPLKIKHMDPYAQYPPPMPGKFTSLEWLSDNRARIKGSVSKNGSSSYQFYIYVPGDLEYLQENLKIEEDGSFQIEATIGRAGRDYDQPFVLKLALLKEYGERMSEIKRTFIRAPHKKGDIIVFPESNADAYTPRINGWEGIDAWLKTQSIDARKRSDNRDFRISNGRMVTNYRYIGYNPDEKYLSWYGRVTLYGSSCIAKALLLHDDIDQAESILRVWTAQIDPNGKIPRSANVIGDNYISPDIRSGDMAHFLGALALASAITGSTEWEKPIEKIVNKYFMPLIDPETGLVQGGYNGNNSQGYNRPHGYSKVPWFSSEHNFDLFQALVLMTQIKNLDHNFKVQCENLSCTLAKGIDEYLWDSQEGTFNRGWRPDTGHDRARALDCSSWGALYCLKQATLAGEKNMPDQRAEYIKKALSCLNYTEDHFSTTWKYKTGSGEKGTINGFRPYDGIINDLVWLDGSKEGEEIDWDTLNDMVWSEGSLGVAKAWEEYAKACGNYTAESRSKEIFDQMIQLQSLSDQGGMLYSTKQIKGHFTMGEELASIAWLGYLVICHDPKVFDWERHKDIIDWVPW